MKIEGQGTNFRVHPDSPRQIAQQRGCSPFGRAPGNTGINDVRKLDPVVLALRRLRDKEHEFAARLSYVKSRGWRDCLASEIAYSPSRR